MSNYPLLNVFLTMMWFFLWILWIFLLIRIIGDVFRSDDLGGWGKAGWTIFLILVPFVGVLVYLIARGGSMHRRDAHAAQASQEAFDQYVRGVAAPDGRSTADQLTKLAALRDQGVITDPEFQKQKERILVS